MKPPRRRPFYSLALGLLAASLVVSACRPKITAPPEPPLAVRLGDDAFRLQDYEAAIEDYRVYIDGVEHGEYTPLAFYQTALCWYRLEQYEQTLDVLSELDRRYPNDHWVQVDALRGDAHYKLERRSAALLAWDEGWSVAEANERPELRRRIVSVLREMDEDELAETRGIVENAEVEALVEHHLAIAQRRPGSEPVPFEESGVASATVPSRGSGGFPSAVAEADTGSAVGTTASSAPPADEVVASADEVSAQADEVARLSDELDETDADVFEAIEDTKQAEGEIRAVDESTATYAPLLRVDIPEPPFVDRPVPEPRKRIMVAPPAEAPPSAPAPAGAPAAPPSGGAVQEEQIISAPGVELERVDPSAAAAVTDEPAEPVSAPANTTGAKVACVLPLTGADRTAGESLLRSVRLIFGEGSEEIIFRDSGSDPAAVAELVAELSADADVLIAIAPATAGEAGAIAASAERAAVPLLLVSPSTVAKSRYVLPVTLPTGDEADAFASEYRARYGAAPDEMSSRAHSAALLARQALLIAPVPRAEVLSRIAVLPPPSKVTSSAGRSASQPPANAG